MPVAVRLTGYRAMFNVAVLARTAAPGARSRLELAQFGLGAPSYPCAWQDEPRPCRPSMKGRTPVKSDAQLKKDVLAELAWDPSINASHVGVAVEKGVVTLLGHLESFAEKHAIERAVQRVPGVHAIAVELDVKLAPSHQRSDSEIALAAETVLKWQARVPAHRIQVQVEQGWVTLRGEVDWDYERQLAEKAVRPLTGVVGLSNAISLKPCAAPASLALEVQQALARLGHPERQAIEVSVDGATVLLSGKAGTWAERNAAERAAWAAPGVCHVVNDIVVRL